MFSQGKPLMTPTNSKTKFVDQLKETKIRNRSFPNANDLITSKSGKLKQTKLAFLPVPPKKFKNNVSVPQHEIILLPLPKNNLAPSNAAPCDQAATATTSTNPTHKIEENTPNAPQISMDSKSLMTKDGRDMVVLIGRVDFCLKTHKLHPNVNALWDVYGQLLRINTGKQRHEHVLILRNQNSGPILQSIYYDFDDLLQQFEIGCYLRVVGQFIGDNRLRTFKVAEVSPASWEQNFTRIQNVTSFILLQNRLSK